MDKTDANTVVAGLPEERVREACSPHCERSADVGPSGNERSREVCSPNCERFASEGASTKEPLREAEAHFARARRAKGEPFCENRLTKNASPRDISLKQLQALAEEMGRRQWRATSDVAQVVANYLHCHPRVEAVRYPGLKSDPLFAKAACTLVGGFGPYVTFRVAGEWRVVRCEEADPRDVVMELERELQRERHLINNSG